MQLHGVAVRVDARQRDLDATVSPASTRAVTGAGTGGLFVATSISRTEMSTRAWAVCPSGPATEYTAE